MMAAALRYKDLCGAPLLAMIEPLRLLMSAPIVSPRRIASLISHSSLSRTWKRDAGFRTGEQSRRHPLAAHLLGAPHALDLSIMTKENTENKGSATFNPIIKGARRSLFMKPCATVADVVGEYSADGAAVFVLPGMAASVPGF